MFWYGRHHAILRNLAGVPDNGFLIRSKSYNPFPIISDEQGADEIRLIWKGETFGKRQPFGTYLSKVADITTKVVGDRLYNVSLIDG